MPPTEISAAASGFAKRLRSHPEDQLNTFADAEIHSGRPFIFSDDADLPRFQQHIAKNLDIADAASDILIVGSARTGFSLDPDRFGQPFRTSSDIDVVVIHAGLFDAAWHKMLAWDYLTIRQRTEPERRWLYRRHDEVWSGWHDPPGWQLRARGGIALSFPTALKPLREFSYQWFSTFRNLSRYRDHDEIPRHDVTARLYRSRAHVAMYHAFGLRALRAKLPE